MVGFLSGDSEWVYSYRVGFIPALKHEAFALTFRNRQLPPDSTASLSLTGP